MSNQPDFEAKLTTALERIESLTGRVKQLETRLEALETGPEKLETTHWPPASYSLNSKPPNGDPDELMKAISNSFEGLGGEGDVAAIKAYLAKAGMENVTRSEINKVLYANKNLFEVARQENLKPIWKKIG